jgi:hypothetical protein
LASAVVPFVLCAVWLALLVRHAGARTLSVVVLGSVVLGPAFFMGARWVRTVPTRWQAGAQGEQRTARLLRSFERRGWVVLHDLAVPGSRANIDHLVIGPGGLFVIDTKRWAQPWHGNDRYGWFCGNRSVAKAAGITSWELAHMTKVLAGELARTRCPTQAVWVVHGPLPRAELVVDGVAIVSPGGLRDVLWRRGRVLDGDQVARIAAAARARFRPAA